MGAGGQDGRNLSHKNGVYDLRLRQNGGITVWKWVNSLRPTNGCYYSMLSTHLHTRWATENKLKPPTIASADLGGVSSSAAAEGCEWQQKDTEWLFRPAGPVGIFLICGLVGKSRSLAQDLLDLGVEYTIADTEYGKPPPQMGQFTCPY